MQDRAYLLRRPAQTVISAPADGVVLTRNVAKRVGDRIAAGEVLLEMVGSGGWLAEVAVAERDLPKIEAGQSARIYVEAYPHMEYQIFDGVVRSVGVESTPGGSYPVRVVLRDSVLTAGGYRLAVGMKTEARIVVQRGRIVELAWVRLMRSLGKVHKEELYVAAGL
jgi:multidrug resistance efflux pump